MITFRQKLYDELLNFEFNIKIFQKELKEEDKTLKNIMVSAGTQVAMLLIYLSRTLLNKRN